MKLKWYQRFNPFFKMAVLTLDNAGRWLADLLSPGFESYTGKNVSVQSALSNTSVSAAVRLIAETIASVPLNVYQRQGEDGKKKARGHPLFYILHTQPNSEMTAFSFWEMAFYNLLLTNGNFYAEIERNLKGDIIALWPLLADNMKVKRDKNTGEIVYIYELPDGSKTEIPQDRIFHLHGLSLNGITGVTPLQMAKESIGLGLAAEEFGARFFGNGGNVNGVLETDDELGEVGRTNLRESFDETYKGLSRSHRLLILEQGMKYKQTGIPPDQAQFLETRKFQVTEIARFFRVPPHMIYDLEHATFSNIEHQSLEFVKYTLLPWLKRVEQTISWKLFNGEEKRNCFAEFALDGLLRGDIESRFRAFHTARQDGIITADEWRAMENWNPLTPEQKAETWRPVNMVPADAPVEHQMKHPAAHTPPNESSRGGDTTNG